MSGGNRAGLGTGKENCVGGGGRAGLETGKQVEDNPDLRLGLGTQPVHEFMCWAFSIYIYQDCAR